MPGPDAAGTGRRGQRGQRSAGTRAYGALRWLPHDAGKRNAARAQHAGRCAGTAQAALEAAGAKRAVRAGGRAGRAVAHLRAGGVYLAWWLPLVGAACYYVLRRRCWLVPAAAAAFVLLYFFIPNMQSLQWGSVVLYVSMALAVAGPLAIGCAIAGLLHFAFGNRKEEKYADGKKH